MKTLPYSREFSLLAASGALLTGYLFSAAAIAAEQNQAKFTEETLAPIVVTDKTDVSPSAVAEAVKAAYSTTKPDAELDENTVRNFNSANNYDSLRLVPGVHYLWGQGGRSGKPSRVRGADNWTISSAIDGFPSISSSGNGAEDGGLEGDFGAIIPAIALESLNVHKGGLGVRHGEGATGGVIVSKIKKGQTGGPRGTLWAEYSPINEALLMADISGASDTSNIDYYVAGKHLNGDYDDFTDQNGKDLLKDDLNSAITKLGWAPNQDSRLEFIGLHGTDTVYTRRPEKEGEPSRIRTNNKTSFAGINWKQALGEQWSYSLAYSYWETDAERLNLTRDRAERLRPQNNHTLAADIFYQADWSGEWQHLASAGVKHSTHQQREEVTSAAKEHHFTDRSIYTTQSFIYQQRLFLNGGVRVGDSESDFRTDSAFAYDLGAAYRFAGPETLLRVSYATDYYRNKGFVFFFAPIETAGGIELAKSATLELGAEQPLARNGRIGATVFRTDTENDPMFSGWGRGVVDYRDTQVQGLEAYGDYWLSETLQVAASYTQLDTEITGSTAPNPGNIGETAVPVPQTTASAALRWYTNDKLWFETLATYDSGSRSQTIDETTGEVTITESASAVRWNLAGHYQINSRAQVFFRAENLLDEEDLGLTQQTSGPDGTSSTALIGSDPGRFITLGVRYDW